MDYGQEEMLDESADVVRIMSIHKSKGLEFPVTFVAGLAKSFNLMDVNKSFLMDMDLGVAIDYVNIKERYKVKSFLRSVMAAKLKEDTLAEELRVLYVALTRAKEKLILTATLEDAAQCWEQRNPKGIERMSFADFLSAGSLLDFLLPTLQEEDVRVSIYGQEDLLAEELSEQLQLAGRKMALEKGEEADTIWKERLEVIFAYQYPHENLQSLYTKTTVSELKIAAMADKDEAAYHAFEEPEPEPILPAFMREQEQQVGGTMRGNAYHKAMELMDFGLVCDEQGEPVWEKVEELLEAHVASGRLDAEYKAILNKYKLMNFLKDPLAKRMHGAQQAGQLYREQPFVLGISAGRLNPDFPSEEKVLIQGIIDAFFVEDGEIVLVDYKTDRVTSGKELWDRYETQLDHYEEALTKLMQMPVKERILYSFSLERCVSGSKSEI